MLQSKYLTEDGLEFFLKNLHSKGYRYLFYDPTINIYTASEQKPYFKDNKYMSCYGSKKSAIVSQLETAIVAELLEQYLYIEIEKHVDCVDWENVPVDTKIIVSHSPDSPDYCRYFAEYKDGKIYAWDYGATSWSSDVKSKNWWEHAKLVK
jgi:hypothetical protein|nr:MAG TPA: hypothetical protein [Caudoviricetes sp.]